MLSKLSGFLANILNEHGASSLSPEDRELLKGLESEVTPSEPLAYAVLLVDLATVDQKFDKREHAIISGTLKELFNSTPREADDLIAEARHVLAAFRDSVSFVSKIKEEYSSDERAQLYAIIEKVIGADLKENSYETLLREKFRKLLE